MLIPLPLPLLRWSGIVQALRRVFAASSFVTEFSQVTR